jgi:3-deoxy-D-manno-octulosonic acid kinase
VSKSAVLGPTARRVVIPDGAMLFDTARAASLRPDWFEPGYWRVRGALRAAPAGRGGAWFVDFDGMALVLRHYRRGGFMARISSDRYFFLSELHTRPFREWLLIHRLHHQGLPVPVPIAARYVRQGATYRGDLITERIDGAESLAERLTAGGVLVSSWVDVGRCIRRFHDVGVDHADLNAYNLLFDSEQRVYMVDFDRGRVHRSQGLWCDRNLVRLRRSIDKICDSLPPGRFGESDWQLLLAGYREPAPATETA